MESPSDTDDNDFLTELESLLVEAIADFGEVLSKCDRPMFNEASRYLKAAQYFQCIGIKECQLHKRP